MSSVLCKVAKVSGWGGIPGAFVLLGLCAYWELRPYQMPEARVTISSKTVRLGDRLEFAVMSCEGFTLSESILRPLGDGAVYSLAYNSQTDDEPGCHDYVVALPVPMDAMKGEHRLLVTAEFRANPIRTIRYRYPVETFVIVGR